MKALSRLELEAIVKAIPAAVVVISKDNGRVIYVNDKAIQLYGVDPRGLEMPNHSTKLMKLLTLKHETYLPEKLPASQALLNGVEAKDDLIIERSDGSRVVVSASAQPVKDEKGNIVAAVGIFQDITERKIIDEELRESEERFRLVAEAASVLVYEVEVEKDILQIFRGEEVLGYQKGEIPTTGDWWFSQIHPEDRAVTNQKLNKAIETGRDVLLEYRIKRKQGDYIIVHDMAKMVFSEEGKVLSIVGGVRDVTERKKNEKALKENEARLEVAQRVAHVGSWEFYVKEDRAIWSKELSHIFGLDPGRKAPNIMEYTKLIHPEDAIGVAAQMERLIAVGKLGETINFDYRIIYADGSIRYLHTERMIGEVDENGKAKLIVGIEQDITERRRAEEALKQRTEELERTKTKLEENAASLEEYASTMEQLAERRAQQLKDSERLVAIGQTAGMVGHDIRNPLQAMISDVYLLKDYLADMPESQTKGAVAESLEGLEKNIAYINKIVADLQDYARPLNPEYCLLNLADLICKVIQTINIPNNVILRVDADASVDIISDPIFIRRVLTNLVNNAVQAMPDGGKLVINASRRNRKVVIIVEDTGVGIPKDVKPKLFTPMVTTKAKGQGLGLAVVKRLVEALGGTVEFESEEGKGTEFIIELPVRA